MEFEFSGKIVENTEISNFMKILYVGGDRGGTVVKVLCYKLEGRWFDSR
jgi:hypothetical protein